MKPTGPFLHRISLLTLGEKLQEAEPAKGAKRGVILE
jgi:hypothetical protein